MNLKNSYSLFIFLGMLLLFCSGRVMAQYTLPKQSILAQNKVKIIHLQKTALRLENMYSKKVLDEPVDHTPFRIATYFMNEDGFIDSIYNIPNDTGYDSKHLFRYDSVGNLVEFQTISSTGEVIKRDLVERTADNGILFRTWDHGNLVWEKNATADSIFYKSIYYPIGGDTSVYRTETFDLENDIKNETYYRGEEITTQDRYQWIAEDGIPQTFIYIIYRSGEGKEKPRNKSWELEIDEEGNAVNEHTGTIFDPFRMYNYYDRYDRFEGIYLDFYNYFRADSLITEQEVSQMLRFDGTDMVYLYQIFYEFE